MGNHRLIGIFAAMICFALLFAAAAPGVTAEDVDWVAHDTSPIDRVVFAYAELPDGRIFISTGVNISTYSITNETWLYDPYLKSWDRVADCTNLTESSCAVAMPDGKVYLFGGMYGPMLEHVKVYDVASDSWSDGPALAEGIIIAEAVALDDHRILLAGGLTTAFLNSATDHAWIFDTADGSFTAAASMPEERCCGMMTVYGSNAYYIGGLDAASGAQDDIFAYNINGDYWWTAGNMPAPLLNGAAVAGSDGNIYIMGGEPNFNWYGPGSDKAYAFNTFTMTVTELPDLPDPMLNAAAFELSDGRIMYLLGNTGSSGNLDVHTLQAWEAHASLSSSIVDQGGSVWLQVGVQANFMQKFGLAGAVYLEKDGVTYASYYLDSFGDNDAILELAIPESLPAGEYTVSLVKVNIGYGWEQWFPIEPMSLTVLEAPSLAEQNQALQDRLDDLSDQLDDLEQQNSDLSDQLDDLEQQNADMAAEMADLREANDAKLDAMIGYIILIMVVATLAVGVVVLVRRK